MDRPTTTDAELDGLERTLLNASGKVPLAKRFRALFTLRAVGSHRAIDIIGRGASTAPVRRTDLAGFADSSALLGHELAYCLGQIDDVHALPILERVLADRAQHPMVRHEVRSRPLCAR